MAINISVRLPWHMDGWNGHVCSDPKANVYCAGRYSYPGNVIEGKKVVETEMLSAGLPCSALKNPPPCALSCNAFGCEQIQSYHEPPDWFYDNSKGVYIDIPPATACIWPYEAMYNDGVTNEPGSGQTYNYEKRLSDAKEYFSQLTPSKTLLVYYSNYSNPFSDDETQKYVIVGIARLQSIGDIHYYENVSENNKQKYAGGFVWQVPLTSSYPDEGFHIPYEKYTDSPEILEKLLFVPDNSRPFKYATRLISDDDMVNLVERFISVVDELIDIGDNSQNWLIRKEWLIGILNQLWKQRGAYPGFPQVLSYLEQPNYEREYLVESAKGNSVKAYQQIKDHILSDSRLKRAILLKGKEKVELLFKLLPRFNITVKQIESIINNDDENGITATVSDIIANPYILCEQYIGDEPDDIISFYQIDNGMLPSPEYGIEALTDANSAERFRALCVEALRWDNTHSFTPSERVLNLVNEKVNKMRDWRQNIFNDMYFEVDEDMLSQAITFRKDKEEKLYLYLNDIYEDEKLISSTLKSLVDRPEIKLTQPITAQHFRNKLFLEDSPLAKEKAYSEAIDQQADVCAEIFRKSFGVISGAAGTGKTTLIEHIIEQIKRTEGEGVSIRLLAPTGKAAERIRDKAKYPATTIHSLLASHGWLNKNYSFKRNGGSFEKDVNTVIIDETSMVDLGLFATLFRCIKWSNVKRLILVGDPNQLPPIGRGKVFSDIIVWLKEHYSSNLAELKHNVRQMKNKVEGTGNGIVELAEILIQEKQKTGISKAQRESILRRIQEGGLVDKDLRAYYWKTSDDLAALIKRELINDLVPDKKEDNLPDSWIKACEIPNSHNKNPLFFQVLSPFRGETYGTDNLNVELQKLLNGYWTKRGTVDDIALFDKVIQFVNRPHSRPIKAYNWDTGKTERIEIFNGDMGFAFPHGYDRDKLKDKKFRPKRFSVKFKGKENYSVGYGKQLDNQNSCEKPIENLELAYAISVHKSQGSEFDIVYVVLPRRKSSTLTMELLYTAVTRAQCKLALFIQDDISALQCLTKIERSAVRRINSSVFKFEPLPQELSYLPGWYEEYKVIATLEDYFVRSKSEALIANALHTTDLDFSYEKPLFAPDGTMYLPDFTITFRGEDYYWEHLGRLDKVKYAADWEKKNAWYNKYFNGKLITTIEGNDLSSQIKKICEEYFEVIL